jgi:glutaredoxin|nr:MAG TPA: NrdH [Caudoviricetes sp.]
MDELVVISAEWCGPCKMLKADMTRRGIPFTNVDASSEEGKALLAKAGVNAVPVLKVGDEFYVGAKAMQYVKGIK